MWHFYCKYRRVFLYFILIVAFYVTLICLNSNFEIGGYGGGHFRRLLDSMLFALPILLCRRKSFVFSYLLAANFYLLSIVWYYRTYGTIMPLSSYLMFDNLKGLGPSINHSIRINDIFLILPSCAFAIWYFFLVKRIGHLASIPFKIYWVLALVFVIIAGTAMPYLPNKRSPGKQPLYLYSTTSVGAFKKYGLIHYWIYQIASVQSVSDDDKRYACAFVSQLSKEKEVAVADSLAAKNKNLILILVESFQSWAVGLEIGGVESVPHINALLEDAETIYFPKVMSQVKDGRSSDAQLLINTGLLPLATGAASSICAANTFPSLPFALKEKGYTSVSFICDEKNFWNQEATTIAYGFDKLYDGMQGEGERRTADENLFKKSLSVLKELKQPFYAQLVTLSSHEPYVEAIIENPSLLHVKCDNVEVKNYLIALQYVDKCIAEFIEGLKKEGLYDNSIIVIAGDHEQMTFNHYEGRVSLEAEDCFVPFMILNSPLSSPNTEKVFGQIDIYPSLLHLMGCDNYSWQGLGESVFGDTVSDYATFRTGMEAGGINVPDSVKTRRNECWKVSDILLRMDYFK